MLLGECCFFSVSMRVPGWCYSLCAFPCAGGRGAAAHSSASSSGGRPYVALARAERRCYGTCRELVVVTSGLTMPTSN